MTKSNILLTRRGFTIRNVNTLRPRQNGRHFPDDIFKCIFLNENAWISIKISLKFVPKGPINKIPALIQIMAWRRSGDKPLSEPMMVSLLTHICVTRPQWGKYCYWENWSSTSLRTNRIHNELSLSPKSMTTNPLCLKMHTHVITYGAKCFEIDSKI